MKICCVSQSVLADDPRVRRQVEALRGAGHEVTAVGYSGGASPPVEPPIRVLAPRQPHSAWEKAVKALQMTRARLPGKSASVIFNSLPGDDTFSAMVGSVPAELYIANDWHSLPSAAKAASLHASRFAYDSHEFAIQESIELLYWRRLFAPFIRQIEIEHIHDAAFVTTVSEGISQAIMREYSLTQPPTVVRNVPMYQRSEFRATQDVKRVLYHGAFLPSRGLEQLIDSVPMWPEDYRLCLRGFGSARYESQLRARAAASRASSRIDFVGRASMTDLIGLANSADIGIFAHQDVSAQARFALPNKLFEYMTAGLAVCTTALPEMAQVLSTYNVGVSFSDPSPQGIAATINQLDAASIDEYKRNSLAAAKELCWENEQQRLVDLV